ncbi:MAG TPA: hypothetical protein DC063_13495 [Arenimonas sp.]|nr:MAG: hypothetical protein A2X76_04110 [Xanthomonadales bacterium GWF1_69_6]HBD20985.1 hypothetical protein [Arenimonas sp.]
MERAVTARARGFTLLEAIVALVIFSIGALALYQWQATNLRTLARMEDRAAQLALSRDALEVVRKLNPMLEPRGERALGDRTVAWRATEIDGPRTGRTPAGYPSLFDLALYDVEVSVLEDGEELTRFTVRQAGFRQVRQATD